MSNLKKQFEALKHHPQAGWMDASAQKRGRDQLMQAIGSQDVSEDAPETLFEYYRWTFVQGLTRPVAAGAMAFLILLSGWFTTIEVASASLPGDPLYGLKLVSERVQVAMTSSEQRAVLHTEFAQRRLEEAVALKTRGANEFIPETMEAFRSQMQEVQIGLDQLKNEGSQQTLSVATVIDQRVDGLSMQLDAFEVDQEVAQEASEAKRVTREVSGSAVETIVDVHETGESQESEVALQQSFRNTYGELVGRQAFNEGRIDRIEGALQNMTLQGDMADIDLNALRFAVASSTDSVASALDYAASGGYRAAFEILDEADAILLDLEAELAAIEFAILNADQEEEGQDDTPEQEGVNMQEGAEEVPAEQESKKAPSTSVQVNVSTGEVTVSQDE